MTTCTLDPERGIVHVFDDVSLDIVLRELDTITDFISYLGEKEELISSGRLEMAAGEEDLLAVYLTDVDEHGEHGFPIPEGFTGMVVDDTNWAGVSSNAQYILKKRLDRPSYPRDRQKEPEGRRTG